MATVTTMAQARILRGQVAGCRRVRIFCFMATVLAVSPYTSIAAETKVTPEIETSSYGFWLRDEQVGSGLDKGLAFMAVPAVSLTYKGPQGSSSVYLKNESVWYEDSQRSHKSLTSYSVNSGITAFDNRVSLAVNAQSGHQVRNSQNNVFSDIITGSENLSQTSSYGATLGVSSRSSSAIQTKLGVSYRKFRSEQPDADDGIGSFDNDNMQANVLLGGGRRASGAFWLINGDYNKTTRESQPDFSRQQVNAVAGLPLLFGLSFIVRGSYEDNSSDTHFSGYYDTFRSYGYGLEYRLGRASHINVTRNHSKQSGDISGSDREKDNDEYYAAEVFLAPSRRSSLSYRYDRRFWGRTAIAAGQYNMRTVSARLSVTESVQVLSNLDFILHDLGIFVCLEGARQITDCVKPPTNNYQLLPGQSFQQLFQSEFEINEELVKRRSAMFNLGYAKRRLKLSLAVSQSEDEYVESLRSIETTSVSTSSAWQINQHTALRLTASHYDMKYNDDVRTDNNILLETGVERQLNEHAKVKLMFRRTVRNSSLEAFDLSENRVWLSYSHRL